MEKIIQLKEREYKELFEKAELKHSEIVRRAEKMYQDKGVYGIRLTLDTNEDFYSTITFKANSYVDWNGKFPISDEDKRNIVKFIDRRATEMMEKKYGRQISSINYWNKRAEYLRGWKLRFIGWTLFGWIAALALVIVNVLK